MKPQRSVPLRIYVLLALVATGVSIALTPLARGRADDSALKLTGADAALFNPAHDCTYCHGLHGAADAQLLQDTTVEGLCVSCHDGSFIAPDSTPAPVADVHRNDPGGSSCCATFRVTCQECHDPHSNQVNRRGVENLKLVLDTVTVPGSGVRRAIVFESLGGQSGPSLYSFCDDDEDNNGIWDQVCDVCHDDPDLGRHHWDGTQQHHRNGATCTASNCHAHSNALNP